MKQLSWFFWLGLIVWLVIRSQVVKGPTLDQSAPQFELSTLSGETISNQKLKGKVVVIDFWATWCPACVGGLPTFERVYAFARAHDDVVAVSVHVPKGAEPNSVRQFMKRNGYTFPVALDTRGQMSAAFQIESIPTLVIVDPNGVVKKVKNGRILGDGSQIIEWIRPLRPQRTTYIKSWGSMSMTTLSP